MVYTTRWVSKNLWEQRKAVGYAELKQPANLRMIIEIDTILKIVAET